VLVPDAEPPRPERVAEGVQVLYLFDEGAGTRVVDHAPGTPGLPLSIPDPAAVSWLPGGGLAITAPTLLSVQLAARKVYTNCLASDEVTLEAWIRPATLEQDGPARIFTYSIDTTNRNFTLGQAAASYNARLRTTQTDNNGTPATVANEAVSITEVQHVVFKRDALEASVWVNGVKSGQQALAGSFTNEWQPSYLLGIGNEITLDRPWLGEIYLAAVYCRALTDAEVLQNFEAGY
jgi:hypothetical protein